MVRCIYWTGRAAMMVTLVMVMAGFAAAQTTEPVRIIERQVIVQGSVGQPGREISYLNCFNPDQVGVGVSVILHIGGGRAVYHNFTIAGGPDRASVNLADVPGLAPRAYFSVEIGADAADDQASALACSLTWHRASDFGEVETVNAVLRRSPKR